MREALMSMSLIELHHLRNDIFKVMRTIGPFTPKHRFYLALAREIESIIELIILKIRENEQNKGNNA